MCTRRGFLSIRKWHGAGGLVWPGYRMHPGCINPAIYVHPVQYYAGPEKRMWFSTGSCFGWWNGLVPGWGSMGILFFIFIITFLVNLIGDDWFFRFRLRIISFSFDFFFCFFVSIQVWLLIETYFRLRKILFPFRFKNIDVIQIINNFSSVNKWRLIVSFLVEKKKIFILFWKLIFIKIIVFVH